MLGKHSASSLYTFTLSPARPLFFCLFETRSYCDLPAFASAGSKACATTPSLQFLFVLFLFCIFETGSQCVAQINLELTIFSSDWPGI